MIPDDNVIITDPVEQWLYFFRRAAYCTVEELTRRLPDSVFDEAAGILQTLDVVRDKQRIGNLRVVRVKENQSVGRIDRQDEVDRIKVGDTIG